MTNDPHDIIRSLLALIAGRDGRDAVTSKFCRICEGKVRHDSTIKFCQCPCHDAWDYLERSDNMRSAIQDALKNPGPIRSAKR